MAFLDELCSLMASKEFKYFRNQYMKQWSDVETMFMYIYMHEYITKEFLTRFHRPISKEEMIEILQRIFSQRDLRQQAVLMFRNYQCHADTILLQHNQKNQKNNMISKLDFVDKNNDKNEGTILRLPSFVFTGANPTLQNIENIENIENNIENNIEKKT
jgi:hypothetical protein